MTRLSKVTFLSEKLSQIDFSYFIMDITIIIDYRRKKNNVKSLRLQYAKVNFLDESLIGLKSDWTTGTWTIVSLENLFLGQSSLGQLLQHQNASSGLSANGYFQVDGILLDIHLLSSKTYLILTKA